MHTGILNGLTVVSAPTGPGPGSARSRKKDAVVVTDEDNCDVENSAGQDFIPLDGPAVARFAVMARNGTAPPPFATNSMNNNSTSQHQRAKRKREVSNAKRTSNMNERERSQVGTPALPPSIPTMPAPAFRPPWNQYGRRYAVGVVGLHEELEDYFRWMIPTPQEHSMRLGVVRRIREAVQEKWPRARVEVFGSFRTGLYLPTSDIDLVIIGLWDTPPLRTLGRILMEKDIAKADTLKVLDKAAVPIVKVTDQLTNVKVDISFNMSNGLRAAELIKHFKKRYPPLDKLIYVLKQFLLQRDLNEVFTGGLSSYALILMVVSFLQLHPRNDATSPKANLGVLLIEFFELYGRNFNFLQTAISVRDGGAYLTKEEMQQGMAEGHRPSMICIEDPLEPSNDVGRSSYGAIAVKQTFERAYMDLTNQVKPGATPSKDKSILSQIVEITPDIQEFRYWVSQYVPYDDYRHPDSDEPHPPSRLSFTSAKDVEPKELSERHWMEPQSNSCMAETVNPEHASKQSPDRQFGTAKTAEDSSDSLSSVSTGSDAMASLASSASSSPPSLSSDMVRPWD